MLRFKQFLEEALHHGTVRLTGSGSKGDRHARNYITPHVGAEQPTHVTTGHEGFEAGTELHVHGFHKDDKGRIQVHVSDSSGRKGHIPASRIYKPKENFSYNDEHATKHVWNRMVGKGIAHSKEKMAADIESAKKNPKHPLSFENAPAEGFLGKKKTENHRKAYYEELHKATDTVHALSKHPDYATPIKEKHTAKVMGGERGSVSDLWKSHGATDRGGISKADLAIGPAGEEQKGIKLSLKKGGGSQLASPGPQEASALHDHAATQMLTHHPKYKNLPQQKKREIHKQIMSDVKTMAHHMNEARGKQEEEIRHHIKAASHALNAIHDRHPELNHYLRHEATSGQGKFGKGSAHAAEHIVIGSSKKEEAHVKRVDDVDHSGARPTISKSKTPGDNASLTMRLKS